MAEKSAPFTTVQVDGSMGQMRTDTGSMSRFSDDLVRKGEAPWIPTDDNLPPRQELTKGQNAARVAKKFVKFIGPGFMVAVAYIDPGNYATDIAAGADSRFALLFMVLLSNMIAIFFQTLCIKLGSVTGKTLSEVCRVHMPKWAYLSMWVIAEIAIIATDVAEVIGTAIAINLLFKVNIVVATGLTILDVVFVLIFYRPKGESKSLKTFEYFVAGLVLTVVISFCVELSLIKNTKVGDVFLGYLPSKAVVTGNGLFLACGILGATVMPHSLFLGSAFVQARLKQFDVDEGNVSEEKLKQLEDEKELYQPTLHAIDSCMKYSTAELALQLFTFALFVNSAILIVAGASLFGNPAAPDADLFGIFDLLSQTIAPAAAIVFALALLMSGLSAGIVCTVASQISTEGFLNVRIKPWHMRLVTRVISIIPSIAIAASGGKSALGDALTASQVILSILLPFISAPLVYYTSRARFMTIPAEKAGCTLNGDYLHPNGINMASSKPVAWVSGALWVVVATMNGALLVLIATGKA